MVNALKKKTARDCDSVIIATDFDREGELIGLEALEQTVEANPALSQGVRRARYSALTAEEINRALRDHRTFDSPGPGRRGPSGHRSYLGRHTHPVHITATSRLGNQFLSVGRVQSPTLALIVERELERRAFIAVPYWQIFADVKSSQGDFYRPAQDRPFPGQDRIRRRS